MRIPEAPRSESHPSHPHPHSKLSSGGSDESRTSSIINPSIHHSHLLKSNSFKSTSSPSHTTSSSYSSPHPSISPFASPRQIPVLDTTKIVKQLVIRARSPSTPQTSGPCHPPSPQAGLDLIMWLKVFISFLPFSSPSFKQELLNPRSTAAQFIIWLYTLLCLLCAARFSLPDTNSPN